jgi:superfamily II DNA or RNA helicase
LKEFQDNNFGLVIFDESHNLKNKSIKTEEGEKIIEKADNVGLFSATPLDKGNQIGYVAKAFNLSKTKLMKALGYELEDQWTGREKIKIWKAKVDPEEIANRIDALFTDLTKNGLAIKREVPLKNLNAHITKIDLTEDQQTRYQQAEHNFLRQIANNPKSKATGLMSLRRFTEELKIDSVVDNIKNEINTNDKKQIVLFATRVNDSDVFDEESLGTLKEISKRLTEQGIAHANVFASSKKAKEDIQNFQDGKVRIILTTPQSGGTGLSLDDTFGDRPRKAIVVTPPFSAIDFIQMAGRINRLNTKSKAEIEMFSTDTMIDGWNKDIIANKLLTLGSAVSGDYKKLDIKELDRLQYMSAEDQREYMNNKNIDQKVPYKEERNISINDFKLNSSKGETSTDGPKIPKYPLRNIDAYKTFIPTNINEEWPDAEIGFGKYKGKKLSQLQDNDASYMRWMFSNVSRDAEKAVGSIKFSSSLQKASPELEEQIIDFFKKNPSPKDEKFHAFMDRMKIEHSIGEGAVYKILSNVLSGGKSKGKANKVNPHELEMGIKVEAEHTNDKFIAEKIARDHLAEFPNYYTELAKMEKKLSKANNPEKVKIVMDEFKKGKLKSSDGKIVTDRKQAIAIAMSESGQGKKMVEDEEIEDEDMEKAKAVPVGTVSGKYKKVANGKWVKVSEKKDDKKDKEPGKKDKKDKDNTESSPKKELIKNALKKIATIFSEMLSGKDPNHPTGQATEDIGERLKENRKWKSNPKEKEQKE